MKVVYALHAIHHVIGKERREEQPNSVIEINDEDETDFVRLGAVREPTKDELTLWKASRPKKIAAAEEKPVEEKPKTAAEKKAEVKAAEEAAAAAAAAGGQGGEGGAASEDPVG